MGKQIPIDWLRIPLSELLEEVDLRVRDLPLHERDLQVLSLTKRRGLIPQSDRFEKRVATEDVNAYKVVRAGWIVYNPYVIWEGAVHALRRSKPGVVSPVYPVWRRREDDGGFIDLVLRTPGIIREYERLAAGAVNRRRSIRKSDFLSILVPCPPLPEQRKVGAVLWSVQRSIDRHEHLILHATELKKALIDKVFTEGTRHERLKRTDIGPLPESWTLVELQDVADSPQYGFTASAQPVGNTQILRITDIQEAGVAWSTVPFCECSPHDLAKYRLCTGDLVFARIGATTGKSYLVVDPPSSAIFASYLIRVRPRAGLLPQFAAYFCQTRAYWRQIEAAKGNNLKGGFNGSLLRRLRIPLPPDMSEQRRIAEVLAALDRKIDVSRRTSKVLKAGFRALLESLASGRIRLGELDLSAIEESVQEPIGVA